MPEIDPDIILPCLSCGKIDVKIECVRHAGHTKDFWRVVCSCGQTSHQWSVSKPAAIRAWNRNLSNVDKDARSRRDY